MIDYLKPCPFCGDGATVTHDSGNEVWGSLGLVAANNVRFNLKNLEVAHGGLIKK